MTISAQVFVPSDEIRKLTRGSYEQMIVDLTAAAEPHLVDVFGESSWEIVSTFANHAIVLGENNECVRVQFETVKGSINVLGVSKYPIKTVTESSYIKSEARKVVDAFISGATTEAKERISELVKKVPAKRGLADDRIVESIQARVKADLPWKRHFAAKSSEFKQFLGEGTIASIGLGTEPRFSGLYRPAPESPVADQDTYYAVVQEALTDLGNKLEGLQQSLEDSTIVLKGLTTAIAALDESEVLTALDTFAQDLLCDIRSVRKVVQESTHQVGRVDCLGRIHDSIAEQFQQYEVAVRFVVEMTKSLSEANHQSQGE